MSKYSRISKLLVIPLFAVILSACTTQAPSENLDLSSQVQTPSPSVSVPVITSDPQNMSDILTINTSKGPIVVKLYPSEAPNTVLNFNNKANSGFYKNLTFHRVEPGFVIQGGDPLGNGTGGGDIASEINAVPFKRGSVGLARGGNIAISNDSQFFICLADETCAGLSNQYVNFGEVQSGMEVVDQIAVGDKILEVTPQK